ncbi:MAG: amino acid deaminase/aldolase [Actinobacteria bacterium]|nr:amino acid deaminase/aldolase [Actinomycetota bacterium]
MATTAPPALHERYEAILADVTAPFAFIDLDAVRANAADMLGRTALGKPIRVASKSVRCRAMLGRVLDLHPRFRGILAFTLPEALWLHHHGHHDVLVAYPTVDRGALEELATRDPATRPVPMVDCSEHVELIAAAAGKGEAPIAVCLDLDASLWLLGGRVKLGPKRSPVHTVAEAVALARLIQAREGIEPVAIMAYEGQIAGVGDEPGNRLVGGAIKGIQRLSAAELRKRRGAAVAAVREVATLRFVNGGGTGSLEVTSADGSVTELAAGSGFYAPHLFDRYGHFTLTPAAGFVLPVVRKPSRDTITLLGGGYLASGPPDAARLPRPWLPEGLTYDRNEGAGEVQTPLTGDAARSLRVGDRVYLRHSKAGELCERFERLVLIEGGAIVDEVPTYRGEGRTFL